MTRITFRSPVTQPLHRADWDRPASGAGVDDFRVTQHFGSPDYYWSNNGYPGRTHGATDIGNARCNYPVVAMAAGVLRRVKDNATAFGAPTDALGVVIDHGDGITTEMWHLNSYAVGAPHGSRVAAGQIVGYHGKTGLGQVCHIHVEAKRNGVKIDPEPLMFGGTIDTSSGSSVSGGDSMRFSGSALKPVEGSAVFRLTSNAWFRSAPDLGEATKIKVFPAGTIFHAAHQVDGDPVGTNDQWLESRLYTGLGYDLGYIHTSVADQQEAPATGGVSEEEVRQRITAAVAAEEKRWTLWLANRPT